MAAPYKKRNIFSFSDEEDEDDIFISSVKPLPSNAVERSAFTATDFDPDTFLSSRRHLGLERMKTELNTHLKSLKTELVELINCDYQDFINLSTNLKGVDKDIEDLKTPLKSMEMQVKVCQEVYIWFHKKYFKQFCYRMYVIIFRMPFFHWKLSLNPALN